MTQVTSTPINPITVKSQKSQKSTQKSVKKNVNAKAPIEQISFLDDFEIIESIYNILDKDILDEDKTLTPGTSRAGQKSSYDSGIDPTMARDVTAITINEPKTLMTSGFNSMIVSFQTQLYWSKIKIDSSVRIQFLCRYLF